MKEIIELAMKGGYDGERSVITIASTFDSANQPDFRVHSVDKALLDPLFWQALGKALGWLQLDEYFSPYPDCEVSEEGLVHGIKDYGRGQITGESRDKKCWWVKWSGKNFRYCYHKSFIKTIYIGNWLSRARQYFDLVLTGGDVEKFWSDLLNK